MIRLDHFSIPVTNWQVSRDWYAQNLGLKVEFEIPDTKTVALVDDSDVTLFLYEGAGDFTRPECALTFQVDNVDDKHAELTAGGIRFENAPQPLFWGYGAELRDPDGYLIRLWDAKTMAEKSGS